MLPVLTNIDSNLNYLLAVSGGIDSMVMAHLFAKSTFKCAIAHCNFSMRGDESDGDENLVKNFAAENGISCFTTRFDTIEYASKNNVSIQVAARELRYGWFEKVRRENGFDKIAIAHNSDDNIETFFINLIRGSGLNGLTGIPAITETLVRPLLEFSRKDIVAYATENQIVFREDSSNLSVKYLRNKLRHIALPMFDDIDSSFRRKVTKTVSYLFEANAFIKAEVEIFMKRSSFTKNSDIYISLDDIRTFHSPELMLFYMLEQFGFKGDMILNIYKSMENAISGKQFFSASFNLLIDREYLIISPLEENQTLFKIFENSHISCEYFELSCETVEKDEHFKLKYDNSIGEFDYDKLQFPLIIRQIEPGDRFIPLGMTGKKKLSDFFIDLKLPQTEKKRCQVIVSGEDIIWVAGLRPDNRFKIAEKTKKVFRINYELRIIS